MCGFLLKRDLQIAHLCAVESRKDLTCRPTGPHWLFLYLPQPVPREPPLAPTFLSREIRRVDKGPCYSLTLCNTPLGSASTSPLMPSRLRVSTLQSPNYISHAPTRSFFFYSLLLFTCHRDLFTYRRENFFSNNLPKKKKQFKKFLYYPLFRLKMNKSTFQFAKFCFVEIQI